MTNTPPIVNESPPTLLNSTERMEKIDEYANQPILR